MLEALTIALFCFGPPLGLIMLARHGIRRKKMASHPRDRCGIIALRVVFYGISFLLLITAYGLAGHNPESESTSLGLTLASLWVISILLVLPVAALVWAMEYLCGRISKDTAGN